MSTSLTGTSTLSRPLLYLDLPQPAQSLANENRVNEAIKVFGSDDDTHPGVKYLLSTAKDYYVGGKLEAVQRLEHYDFLDLRCEFSSFTLPFTNDVGDSRLSVLVTDLS